MKYLVSLAIILYICLTTSVAAKIGIAQVGTASSFLLLLLFIQRVFLYGFDNIVGRFKEEAALYVITILVVIFKFLIGETAAIQQIFFFLTVPASFSILLGLQKLKIRKTMVLLITILFVVECLLAIYERITLTSIFPYTTKLEAVEGSAFRSTSLMGHPLTNALVVSILMGFIATSYFANQKKAILLVLGFVSLLCFNARGASLAWVIIGAIYLYNFVKTNKIKSSTILAMFFGSLIVIGTLATLIFQYNFGARLVNDQLMDGSAMTRVQVFAAFNFVNSTDFWLGNFENYIPIMKKLGAGGVENSYVVLILNYGIVMAVIICIGLFFLCKRLLKPVPGTNKLIIILSFIMVGSMNNALVSSLPWSVFILCTHAFMPLNKYYEKREKLLKKEITGAFSNDIADTFKKDKSTCMKKIAILLTVFNRKEKTLTCLNSIFKLDKPTEISEPDVFLVDDGSTDGTSQAVLEYFPQVTVIQGTGSLFWNRGMHLAWQSAAKADDYDFYLWLNDDTFFYKNSLKALLDTSARYHDKNIVVGTTCAVGNPQVITYGGRSNSHGIIHPKNEPIECDYFNGNMVLITRQAYSLVGMNDRFFRHALGDFDYGLRAAKSGIKLIIAPGVLGECDEHESLPVWCNPEKPFSKRWKAFRSPLGQNPEEFFVFERRHNGFLRACLHYLTNHLRVVCPTIWNSRNKTSSPILSGNS